MKKFAYNILILSLVFVTLLGHIQSKDIPFSASTAPVVSAFDDDSITVYAPDGRELVVYNSELQTYKNNGWYENKSDVTKTMYAPDGREISVYLAEVPAYTSVGWYENKADVIKTMYAPDGREISVYLAEVPSYISVGWYENKADVTKTLYAPDGREILVYLADVAAYTSLGWYESKSDVTQTLYAPDGRQIVVYNSEVETYIALGWRYTPIRSLDSSKPMVALTFDDGPRPQSTGRILNTLEAYNSCATFFVVGYLAASYPDILRRMDSMGCQIGNHTYNHPDLSKLSAYGITSQISRTDAIVESAVGSVPTAIRPPYGSRNSIVINTCDKPLILWSIDTLDWKSRNAASVINKALASVSDGDIILMHDLYDSTAAAVETIVPELISRGFQLVTVDEMSYYKNRPMSAHNAYSSFK